MTSRASERVYDGSAGLNVSLGVPDVFVEQVAVRVAELLAARPPGG
jgi:hypothetical protein